MKKVEDKLNQLQKSNSDKKKVLTDLNAIKEEMEKRRDQLGNPEALKKNLAGLKPLSDGPAEKAAEAIKDGDFEKASDEMEKIMEGLESGSLSPEQMEQLAKQMDQLNKALDQAVAEHEQAKADLEKQINQAEQAGDIQKAAELRKQLEEKKADDAGMKQMAELAENMKQAKDALEKVMRKLLKKP